MHYKAGLTRALRQVQTASVTGCDGPRGSRFRQLALAQPAAAAVEGPEAHGIEGFEDGGWPLHSLRAGDMEPHIHARQLRHHLLVPHRHSILPPVQVTGVRRGRHQGPGRGAQVSGSCTCYFTLAHRRSKEQPMQSAARREGFEADSLGPRCSHSRMQCCNLPQSHLSKQPVLCRAGNQQELPLSRDTRSCGCQHGNRSSPRCQVE